MFDCETPRFHYFGDANALKPASVRRLREDPRQKNLRYGMPNGNCRSSDSTMVHNDVSPLQYLIES